MDNSLLYKIAITKIPLVGTINAKNLISYCGGVEAVFFNSKKALLKIPGVGVETASSIVEQSVLKSAEAEIEFIEKHNIKSYFYLDEDYPARLKHYEDCPVMLYFRGNANLNHHRNVAIVGTRKPTPQGRIICEELVEGLQAYDVNIISGLALGIDVTAHKKSVDLGIDTVGVLGHGLSMIYPSQHKAIAEQMLERGGLLTEFTSQLTPEREHFPMRNRIVAGLCDALIVVETANKGGSMISAEIANAYNKDVFAVPGRLNDKTSAGCNRLIKTHKAALIESAKDISYIMRWEEVNKQAIQKKMFVELNSEEQKIVDLLQEVDSVSIDKLSYQTSFTSSEMAGLLLGLEFKGMIKTLPGKRYMLV